jgi:hypothetical protein
VRFDVLWIIKNGVPYMGKEKRKQQDFQWTAISRYELWQGLWNSSCTLSRCRQVWLVGRNSLRNRQLKENLLKTRFQTQHFCQLHAGEPGLDAIVCLAEKFEVVCSIVNKFDMDGCFLCSSIARNTSQMNWMCKKKWLGIHSCKFRFSVAVYNICYQKQ